MGSVIDNGGTFRSYEEICAFARCAHNFKETSLTMHPNWHRQFIFLRTIMD